MRSFENDLLVFDGDSGGQVARYGLNEDLSLREKGRLSMQNEGVSSFFNTIAFISPTRAYLIDRDVARVVVWNPRDMTLTGSFPFELAVDDFPDFVVGAPSVHGDQVLAPVAWTSQDGDTPRPVVGVARFAAEELSTWSPTVGAATAQPDSPMGIGFRLRGLAGGSFRGLRPEPAPASLLARLRSGFGPLRRRG